MGATLGLLCLDCLPGGADVIVGNLFNAKARQLLRESLPVPKKKKSCSGIFGEANEISWAEFVKFCA